MGLGIRTHLPSIVSYQQLNTVRNRVNHSLEKLSSGSQINSAEDHPSRLALSETLRWQMHSLTQAERNAQDGIAALQTTEGGLAEITQHLIHMHELSIQAASHAINEEQRGFINTEFQNQLLSIQHMIQSTTFNETSLLNTQNQHEISVQIGTQNIPWMSQIQLTRPDTPDLKTIFSELNHLQLTDVHSAQESLSQIDSAFRSVSIFRSRLGALQQRLDSTLKSIHWTQEQLADQNSKIRDTDLAQETTELTKNQILMQSGIAVLSQANLKNEMIFGLLGQGGRSSS